MSVAPVLFPRYWWGLAGEDLVSPTVSIVDLIQQRVLSPEIAALVGTLAAHRAPLISVGGFQRHTGKTTLLNALLGFAPAATTFVVTKGNAERFEFLEDSPPERTCVLVGEFSDHMPRYLWGQRAARVVRLVADGYTFAGTMHAQSVDDLVEQFVSPPVSLERADLARTAALLIFQDFRETPAGVQRKVTSVARLYPAPRGPGGLGAKSLAVWDPRDDTWNLFSSEETWDELSRWAETTASELRAEVDGRHDALLNLVENGVEGYDRVRAALVGTAG
ncbi:MAG: hypothetical protein EXR51_11905 [Dehalococcoidia bacterium]|nr:hypothetical protein [Dehalococcoidia bacterium]